MKLAPVSTSYPTILKSVKYILDTAQRISL